MSRSYRHSPIHGHGGGSEKQDKRIYNRRHRAGVRQRLHSCADFEALVLPIIREDSNLWDMSKDGKSYDDSLAEIGASLRQLIRLRDGRTRKIRVITDATCDVAAGYQRQIELRFCFAADSASSWLSNYYARHDANFYVDSLRK